MSKASEWAAVCAERDRLIRERDVSKRPCFVLGHHAVAGVSPNGNLHIVEREGIAPADALRLAHWIIDTFGDE